SLVWDRTPSARTSSALPLAIVGDYPIPLVGAGAGDDGDHRVRVADVEHLVGYAGFDEDEVAGLVLDALLEPGTVLVPDAALQDVEHHFESVVDVRVEIGRAS